MERTLGWRHFEAVQKRGQGREAYVLLESTCDRETKLWVNLQNLKDRARWASGWLQKEEMRALEAERDEAAQAGPACKACGASGLVACPLCSRGGQVVEL
ncbi:hypothetical protein C2E21_5358 [Chlorella sorokiniana]|uniref:TIGR02450 family Trp-rich protein n=1 Tax=Chlorella sorokiniana TaxID=3076 RepID=A0A2P6TNX9_CHLSO|nr:hypothetical protein C2E21_5358 [Chlorella sorokiniana]|eukprot:PRW51032.1 hypothetical protein C2E21_5358 [Chlorella sorokiniana]